MQVRDRKPTLVGIAPAPPIVIGRPGTLSGVGSITLDPTLVSEASPVTQPRSRRWPALLAAAAAVGLLAGASATHDGVGRTTATLLTRAGTELRVDRNDKVQAGPFQLVASNDVVSSESRASSPTRATKRHGRHHGRRGAS